MLSTGDLFVYGRAMAGELCQTILDDVDAAQAYHDLTAELGARPAWYG